MATDILRNKAKCASSRTCRRTQAIVCGLTSRTGPLSWTSAEPPIRSRPTASNSRAKSLYGTLAELLPGAVWAAVAAALLAFILYGRLASRMDNLETSLELLNGKLDTILSHLNRSRTKSRT